MRIWSLHPKYLDPAGLVALWRETLLAKHVLEDKTKGYKNHPQLIRFKKTSKPTDAINQYLEEVFTEASLRGYNFNPDKFTKEYHPIQITVTNEQLKFEFNHLVNKLKKRNFVLYEKLLQIDTIEPHPLFEVIEGPIEDWEII